VRLADVAELAGVGTSIVSRVLNGDPTVSTRPETRDRILEAARKLDYRPNALARGLRLSRTMSIGIVINLAYYHENAEILVAVERAAAAEGFVTLIADSTEFVGRGEAYRRLLRERRVDGLLIASLLVSDEFIRELRDERLPFVVLNRRGRLAGPSVSVDEAVGMRRAVEHLASLGHERIAYIAGPANLGRGNRRIEGMRQGMREAGLRVSSKLIATCECDNESVFATTEQLLAQTPRPTAVCVWSPTAAVPVLAAAKQSGFSIPDDLSIVAYNDSPIMDYLDPSLATVRMPLGDMARTGVDSLLRIIDGEQVESVVVHESPVLVERRSTAPAPAVLTS
jgi:LacI family transcriptional regulator